MARYTLEQILAMQSPENVWGNAGYTKAGWQDDDGQDMWYGGDDGEGSPQLRSTLQLMNMMENGNFESGANLLPDNIIPWNLQDTSTPAWFNQRYGTNFNDYKDYLNYLYGPGGEFIERGQEGNEFNPANATDYYILPEGKTAADYVNAPLRYDSPDSGLGKWMPAILGGVALAGLGGLLPGTTSIFGGTPAFAGGASGGGIAGGATGAELATGGALGAGEAAAIGGAGAGAVGAAGTAAAAPGGFDVSEFIKSGAINGSQGMLPPLLPSGAGIPLTSVATSALSKILNGTAESEDWMEALGTIGSTGLGLYGANQQADAYGDLASKYLDMGQPYRDKLLASYQPGFSMADQPDFQNALDIGAQAAARATSAKVGNPVGNPGAYSEMEKYISGSLALPALNTYRSQLGTFGQFGTNQAGTAQMGEIQSQGGMYDALGSGLASLTKPKNPYEDLMKGLLGGFKLNTGTSL